MNATAEITSQARLEEQRKKKKKSRWVHSEGRMKFSAILFVSYLAVCVSHLPAPYLTTLLAPCHEACAQFLPPGHKFETCGGAALNFNSSRHHNSFIFLGARKNKLHCHTGRKARRAEFHFTAADGSSENCTAARIVYGLLWSCQAQFLPRLVYTLAVLRRENEQHTHNSLIRKGNKIPSG